MESVEIFWDIEEFRMKVAGDEWVQYWASGNPGGGVLGRSGCEEDVRAVLLDYRRKGRPVRLVKVTREVIDSP